MLFGSVVGNWRSCKVSVQVRKFWTKLEKFGRNFVLPEVGKRSRKHSHCTVRKFALNWENKLESSHCSWTHFSFCNFVPNFQFSNIKNSKSWFFNLTFQLCPASPDKPLFCPWIPDFNNENWLFNWPDFVSILGDKLPFNSRSAQIIIEK